MQAKETLLVDFPAISGLNIIERIRYEVGLLVQLVTGVGLKQHSSPQYMEHLISVTRIAALTPPPAVRPPCIHLILFLEYVFLRRFCGERRVIW